VLAWENTSSTKRFSAARGPRIRFVSACYLRPNHSIFVSWLWLHECSIAELTIVGQCSCLQFDVVFSGTSDIVLFSQLVFCDRRRLEFASSLGLQVRRSDAVGHLHSGVCGHWALYLFEFPGIRQQQVGRRVVLGSFRLDRVLHIMLVFSPELSTLVCTASHSCFRMRSGAYITIEDLLRTSFFAFYIHLVSYVQLFFLGYEWLRPV